MDAPVTPRDEERAATLHEITQILAGVVGEALSVVLDFEVVS